MAVFAAALAWPWTTLALVLALLLLAATGLAVTVLDWSRLPRAAEVVPPIAGLVLLGAVRVAAGTDLWTLLPGILLIVLWLGLHHPVRQLWLGIVVAVLAMAVPDRSGPEILEHVLLGVLLGLFAIAISAGQRERQSAIGQLEMEIDQATTRLRHWAATRRGVLFKIDHEGFLTVEEDRVIDGEATPAAD
jgi:hypothetical protein